MRIAKLQKQAFGTSSEKIEAAKSDLALEDLLVLAATQRDGPVCAYFNCSRVYF